jgi:beta-phosphoglucomutase-like phosphatase (HAD superfamily)
MSKAFPSSSDTITFDGEGVVIDSEPIWDHSQREFLRRRGIAYDRETVKPLLAGRSLESGAALLQQKFGFPGDPTVLGRERMEIVRQAFESEIEFVPGFAEFYEHVSSHFKTCMATVMSSELLDIVTRKLHLDALFGSRIFSPDRHNLPSKPAPDLFLYAAAQLGSKPGCCIVIEDSPNGLEAASRAGMFSIGIATTFSAEKLTAADMIVHSFAEIRILK